MILPAVDPAFEWQRLAPGPALVCRPLAAYARHFFTTRSWALGAPAADGGGWAEIAGAIDVATPRLIRMRQVHGADAIEAIAGAPLQPADIVVGAGAELALAVQAADCVPLLVVDARTGAAAAAHAGWRGLAAGVPARTLEALSRTYGSRAGDLIVAGGPSIGACCYEVGADVRASFAAAFGRECERWFLTERPAGRHAAVPAAAGRRPDAARWFFDGWCAVADQWRACGVPAERIFLPRLCTAGHPGVLCSYRRDGAPAGRLAGVIRPAAPQ